VEVEVNTQAAEAWTESEPERAVVDDATLLGRLRRRAGLLRRTQPLLAAALEEIIEQEAARPKTIPLAARRDCVLWAAERAAAACYVTRESILSSCKSKNTSRARALAISLCRARYGWSWPELARAFRLDPSTVGAALKRAKRDQTWEFVEAEERRVKAGS
jgi:chromosomal replication initiation ATPase DnaA